MLAIIPTTKVILNTTPLEFIKTVHYTNKTSSNHSNLGVVARNINCIVYLTIGDYIEIFAENYQSSVSIDSYSGKTYFEVKQIR